VTKVAIFDRDATVIDVVRDEELGVVTVAFHPDQIRVLPGAIEGMRALANAGFVLALATNQPGPAKGQFSAAAVARTNEALVARLALEGVHVAAVEVCMHHPDGGPGGDPALLRPCNCRKPKPGMLDALMTRLGGNRQASWMIGDSVGDVQAGRAAGLKTGLVFATTRCELCPLKHGLQGAPDAHGATLQQLAEEILGRR
jgi:D-glycero-D-manno-heptose 1,7-bisphosphate phosphatase